MLTSTVKVIKISYNIKELEINNLNKDEINKQ